MDVLEFSGTADWESWLDAEHDRRSEAWLRIGKRHSDVGLIGIGEAGDAAMCFGWIDGHRKGLDDVSFLQRYSLRRQGSSWSKVNVARAEALIAAGRMRPAGLAEVDEAKADGRWEAAYESQRVAEVPADLKAALAGAPLALAAFERLGRSDRYALILPLLKSRTPTSRARLVVRAVEQLTRQA